MNLKKGIATALLLSVATLGAINVNINIDSKKFWSQAERGELYTTSFNIKQYKLLRADLAEQMDRYLTGGEPLTYQGVQVYLKIVSKEASKDSFEKIIEVDKEVDGEIIKVSKKVKIKGWQLEGDINGNNLYLKLNKRLKTKI